MGVIATCQSPECSSNVLQMSDLSPEQIRRQAIVNELEIAYDRVKGFPEDRPDGFIRLLELRQLVPDILHELRRGLPVKKKGEGMQANFRFSGRDKV